MSELNKKGNCLVGIAILNDVHPWVSMDTAQPLPRKKSIQLHNRSRVITPVTFTWILRVNFMIKSAGSPRHSNTTIPTFPSSL